MNRELLRFVATYEKRRELVEKQARAVVFATGLEKEYLELWIRNNRAFLLENEERYTTIIKIIEHGKD